MLFLSTPSARRATICLRRLCKPDDISIHALREEGDHQAGSYGISATNFYPRPPRGGRPPIWQPLFSFPDISIHALREEGDLNAAPLAAVLLVFLSTPSARRATGPLGLRG